MTNRGAFVGYMMYENVSRETLDGVDRKRKLSWRQHRV